MVIWLVFYTAISPNLQNILHDFGRVKKPENIRNEKKSSDYEWPHTITSL